MREKKGERANNANGERKFTQQLQRNSKEKLTCRSRPVATIPEKTRSKAMKRPFSEVGTNVAISNTVTVWVVKRTSKIEIPFFFSLRVGKAYLSIGFHICIFARCLAKEGG